MPELASDILRKFYFERVEKNASYSLRAFSRDLHLSHGFLSRVLSGKRNLSFEQSIELAQLLEMNNNQKQLFLQAVTEALLHPKKKTDRISRSSSRVSHLTLEVDRFKFINEWYHSAILELMALKDFEPKASWIAKQLGLPSGKVKMALNRLTRLGLIEVLKNGEIKRKHQHLIIPSEPSSALRAFHRQMINKALQELDYGKNPSARDITGTTIAIDPNKISEIKTRIKKFRKNLMAFSQEGTPTQLYQLNVQFFSLIKARQKQRELK